MKNTFKGWMLAASAMLGVGFTSCQSEISDINNSDNEANKVYVTITASLGDDTRATLSKDGNILKFGWTSNDETKDKIEVVDASTGNWLGTLDVTKVHDDITKCDFSGQIIAPEGNCTLKFYYLASYTIEKEFNNGVFVTTPLSINFEEQNGLESPLSKSDVLIGTKTYENGVNGNLGYVNFDREFTYAQFVLKHNGEELDVRGAEVTIENAKEGSTLHNVATLDYANGSYTYTDGSIKISVPEDASEEAGKGFFVKFFPQENVELKFTCTVGNNTFVGTRATSTGHLVKNLLYTESGTGDPMIVEMKNTDGSDDKVTYTVIYKDSEGENANIYTETIEFGINDDKKFNVKPYYKNDSQEVSDEFNDFNSIGTFNGWYVLNSEDNTIHSPYSTISFNDKENSIILVAEYISEVGFEYVYDNQTIKDIQTIYSSDSNQEKSFTIKDFPEGWTTPEGKGFIYWTDDKGNRYYAEDIKIKNSNNGIVTLTPRFGKIHNFLIGYKNVRDQYIAKQTIYVSAPHGSKYTLLAYDEIPTRDDLIVPGFVFEYWEYKGNKYQAGDKIILTEDEDDDSVILIYAKGHIEGPTTSTVDKLNSGVAKGEEY